MPLDQIANFIRGDTDADTDSTQTTISVVDASVFPDPANGEYNLVFWDSANHPRPDQDPDVEVVRVTGRDTTNDDLTVTRAQEGTAGAAHPSGSALHLSPTAAVFGDVAATDATVEDFTTGGGSGTVPTSQGDGTLEMEPGGVSDHAELSNVQSDQHHSGRSVVQSPVSVASADDEAALLDGDTGTVGHTFSSFATIDITLINDHPFFEMNIYVNSNPNSGDLNIRDRDGNNIESLSTPSQGWYTISWTGSIYDFVDINPGGTDGLELSEVEVVVMGLGAR